MDTKNQLKDNEERNFIPYNSWVTKQMNLALESLKQGTAEFVTQEEANAQMEDFKAKVRNKISYVVVEKEKR